MNTPHIHSASRVIMGHCPQCGGVVVQLNEYGVWEPAQCQCGWQEWADKARPELVNKVRIERDFVVCTGPNGDIKVRTPPPPPVETVNVTSEAL